MVEKMKDAEDRLLESLFASPQLADDGFSVQIVGKIRRRTWLRRLIIPLAAAVGGLIAFKPLAALMGLLTKLSSLIPKEFVSSTTSSLPQLPIVVLGAMLLAACLLGMRLLED